MAEFYPIDPEIIQKNIAIPKLVAKLSYLDERSAITFIRHFGEMTIPVTPLYDQVLTTLNKLEKDPNPNERL